MNLTTRTFCLTLCAAASLTLAVPSFAQGAYPDHPVKVIVALPAGGSVDMIARQISQQWTTDLGQPFVVDNQRLAAQVTDFFCRLGDLFRHANPVQCSHEAGITDRFRNLRHLIWG